jgi:hypothetical protein
LIDVGLVASAAAATAAAAAVSAAAAPAAAVSTATAATAAATAARAIFARTRFIDGQATTVTLFAVQGFDCGVRFSSVSHSDKSKSAGTSGFAILNHNSFNHSSEFGELIFQRRISDRIGQIPDIQFLAHIYSNFSYVFSSTSWNAACRPQLQLSLHTLPRKLRRGFPRCPKLGTGS